MPKNTSSDATFFESLRPCAMRFFSAIEEELQALGVAMDLPSWDAAELSVHREQDDATPAVIGHWESSEGGRIASWLITPSGDGFFDLDVLRRHPRSPSLFIEAISVYGEGDQLQVRTRYQSRRAVRGARHRESAPLQRKAS